MTRVQLRCTGSFLLGAGIRRLHRNHKFAEPLAKTVALSLRHSCRSELTRQGISLDIVTPTHQLRAKRGGHFCHPLHVAMQSGLYLLPSCLGVWRTVSEDSRDAFALRAFPADRLHPSHCHE